MLPRHVAGVSLFSGQSNVALLPQDEASKKWFDQSVNLNSGDWEEFKNLPDILDQLANPVKTESPAHYL